MDFLVMLEEGTEQSPVLARVDSVPASLSNERKARDVVTLYGTPRPESLALALAAAVESRRATGDGLGAFRHLGVSTERGAVGDTAWRDESTGEFVTHDLVIPLEVLTAVSHELLTHCGTALHRLVAALSMPDWPEGVRRAIGLTLDPLAEQTRTALGKLDGFLDAFREADALTFEYEAE